MPDDGVISCHSDQYQRHQKADEYFSPIPGNTRRNDQQQHQHRKLLRQSGHDDMQIVLQYEKDKQLAEPKETVHEYIQDEDVLPEMIPLHNEIVHNVDLGEWHRNRQKTLQYTVHHCHT